MSNNISGVIDCTNCLACFNICPVKAISINKDGLFYSPKVDEKLCVSCGFCKIHCPVENVNNNLNVISAYGGWAKDKSIRKLSSSGGMFSLLANYVLEHGGIVFGAAYSNDFKSVIISNTDETSLDNLRRSKYVESLVNDSFNKAKKALEIGRLVLYSATPCQIAGLRKYLEKEYDNLICVDFACGGLTSHKLYKEHIESLEKKYNSKVVSVNFRPGTYGWRQYAFKVDFSNKKKYEIPSQFDPYVYAFMYARTGNRNNCMNCKFRENHYSDLILADFWKWNTLSSLRNDEKGISLVLVNSIKGQIIMNELSNQMVLVKLDIDESTYNCKAINENNKKMLANREKFFSEYEKRGLKNAAILVGMHHGFHKLLRMFIVKLRRCFL